MFIAATLHFAGGWAVLWAINMSPLRGKAVLQISKRFHRVTMKVQTSHGKPYRMFRINDSLFIKVSRARVGLV
jgi:hypothetical protein